MDFCDDLATVLRREAISPKMGAQQPSGRYARYGEMANRASLAAPAILESLFRCQFSRHLMPRDIVHRRGLTSSPLVRTAIIACWITDLHAPDGQGANSPAMARHTRSRPLVVCLRKVQLASLRRPLIWLACRVRAPSSLDCKHTRNGPYRSESRQEIASRTGPLRRTGPPARELLWR